MTQTQMQAFSIKVLVPVHDIVLFEKKETKMITNIICFSHLAGNNMTIGD